MLTINDSSLVQLKAENIDLNDRIYLAKSGNTIGYSLKMSELIKKLKTDIIPAIKDYNFYSGVTNYGSGRYLIKPNIQQKFGFSTTDTSQEFWDALADNVVRGNASRIQYGDIVYMPVTYDFGGTSWTETLWRVVDINRYSEHDLVFCPAVGGEISSESGYIEFSYGLPQSINRRSILYGKVYMDGSYTKYYNNRIGWVGCGVRCAFNGVAFKSNDKYPNVEPDWIPQVPALSPTKTAGLNKVIDDACHGHLRKISRHLHMLANPHLPGSIERDEEVVDYAFLPKEIELFGNYGYGVSDPLENGETAHENRFKYYRIVDSNMVNRLALYNCQSCTICKSDSPFSYSNDSYGDYWCTSEASANTGIMDKQSASNWSGYTYPYWCFGTGN